MVQVHVMPTPTESQLERIVDAIQAARFFIHVQRDSYVNDPASDPTGEGLEIANETLIALAAAVVPLAPHQMACGGCGRNDHELSGCADAVVAAAGERARRWREEHPEAPANERESW